MICICIKIVSYFIAYLTYLPFGAGCEPRPPAHHFPSALKASQGHCAPSIQSYHRRKICRASWHFMVIRLYQSVYCGWGVIVACACACACDGQQASDQYLITTLITSLRWDRVAEAVPIGLLTGRQSAAQIKAAVMTYQMKAVEIEVGYRQSGISCGLQAYHAQM